MGRYKPENPDLLEKIRELERRISAIERTPQLGNASVDRGSVTVYSGQGEIVFMHNDGVTEFVKIGLFNSQFGPIDDFRINYLDGAEAFRFQTNLFGFENWAFLDSTGNIVLDVDPRAVASGVNDGVGLSRPYIPVPFFTNGTPSDSTSSGTFTILQRAAWRLQHPTAEFWVKYNVTATTGEIRFVVAGNVVGGPFTIPNGNGILYCTPFLMTTVGSHMDTFEVEAQARVASGAGNVAVDVIGYGRQRA